MRKDKIIWNLIMFFDTGEAQYRKEAMKGLDGLFTQFRVPFKRSLIQLDAKKTLLDFILNKDGYLITLPKLKNYLLNVSK